MSDAESPERPGGRIVRIDCQPADTNVVIGIGASGMGHRTVQHGASQGGIRAGVRHDSGDETDKLSRRVAAQPQADGHGMALHVDPRTLRPVQGAFYRPSAEPCKQGRMVLDGLVFFSPEGPADIF